MQWHTCIFANVACAMLESIMHRSRLQRRDPADPPGAHLPPTLLNPHCHCRPPWPLLWPSDPQTLSPWGPQGQEGLKSWGHPTQSSLATRAHLPLKREPLGIFWNSLGSLIAHSQYHLASTGYLRGAKVFLPLQSHSSSPGPSSSLTPLLSSWSWWSFDWRRVQRDLGQAATLYLCSYTYALHLVKQPLYAYDNTLTALHLVKAATGSGVGVKCRLADYTLTCTFILFVIIIAIIIIIVIITWTESRRVYKLLVHWVQVSVAFGRCMYEGTSASIVLSVYVLHKWISKCLCMHACISITISVWSDMSECIISVSSGWTEPRLGLVCPAAWLQLFWK